MIFLTINHTAYHDFFIKKFRKYKVKIMGFNYFNSSILVNF